MPPKARPGTTSPLKRKAHDEGESSQPVKRTRGSGLAPSHFVPLNGAPDAPKYAKATSSAVPPRLSPAKKRDKDPVQTLAPRFRKAARVEAAAQSTKDDQPVSSSEDEISLPSPSKKRSPVSRAPRNKLIVPEVEITTQKPKVAVTYKSRRKVEASSHVSASDDSDDELLLSPTKPSRIPIPSSPTKSALRSKPSATPKSRLPESRPSTQVTNGSPSKKARFVSGPSPPPNLSTSPRKPPQNGTSPRKKKTRATSPLRTRNVVTDSEEETSEGEVSSAIENRTPQKSAMKRGRLSGMALPTPRLSSIIKRPEFGTPKSAKKSAIFSKAPVATTDDDEESEATPRKPPPSAKKRPPPLKRPSFGEDEARPSSPTTSDAADMYDSVPESPTRSAKKATPLPSRNGHATPRNHAQVPSAPSSPSKSHFVPSPLPPELLPCLEFQKRACLRALTRPSLAALPDDSHGTKVDPDALLSLLSLLKGTTSRGEGNSCLLLGPRRSGKTLAVEEAISRLEKDADDVEDASLKPIVIRLSGHVHTNDRMALREIGRQLLLQNGPSELELSDKEDNSDDDDDEEESDDDARALARMNAFLPPPSHMSSLITTMSSLPRPTIVVLDAFDLFTAHARQALLYCLLDTVQSCRAGEGRKGVAVVGVTTRMDTLNLLEKRVKSRFSHRIIRCPPPTSLDTFIDVAKTMLAKRLTVEDLGGEFPTDLTDDHLDRWSALWHSSIESCLESREVKRVLKETFELVRDIGMLNGILATSLITLNPKSPWLTPSAIVTAASAQRAPDPWAYLRELTFCPLALLVAAFHAQTVGHDAFTFEHIFDIYSRAARNSTNNNVAMDGVIIGLPRTSRQIMIGAFETLITSKVFQPSGGTSASTAIQFVKYRCDVPRPDVKAAIDAKGHTQLKRWLTRPV